jgi:hypothetical protein
MKIDADEKDLLDRVHSRQDGGGIRAGRSRDGVGNPARSIWPW